MKVILERHSSFDNIKIQNTASKINFTSDVSGIDLTMLFFRCKLRTNQLSFLHKMEFYRKICNKLYWQKVTIKERSFFVRLTMILFSIFALFGYAVVFDIEGVRFIKYKRQLLNSKSSNLNSLTFEQMKKLLSCRHLYFTINASHFFPTSAGDHLSPALRL